MKCASALPVGTDSTLDVEEDGTFNTRFGTAGFSTILGAQPIKRIADKAINNRALTVNEAKCFLMFIFSLSTWLYGK